MISVLAPLRTTAAGTQTVTIMLHPEELGDVRATVTVTGDLTTVRLVASTSEATNALRSALPELQAGLSGDGQRSTVLLGDPGAGSSTPGGQDSGERSTYEDATSGRSSAPAVSDDLSGLAQLHASANTTTTTHHLLDVRL